ncbi:MAG: hypothetical protein ACYDBJ_20555 [Aggregatilineales bacterium]
MTAKSDKRNSAFDEFLDKLELPETTCDQVHPIVEDFISNIDPGDPEWPGQFSDWMDQANSCLTNELLDVIGEPPEDPDDLQSYLWGMIRISWLFYQKFHDGAPFDT